MVNVLKHNKRLFIYGALADALFQTSFAFFMLFLLTKNISISQVGIIEATIFLMVFLFEIPSSIISDKWSRKYTLVLANLSFCISFTLFIFSSQFVLFLVAALFYGVGRSFNSGTREAITYDSFVSANKVSEYKSFIAKRYFIWLGVAAVLTTLTGFIIGENYVVSLYISLLGAFSAFLISLWYKEPSFEKSILPSKSHLKKSFNLLINKRILLIIFIFSILIYQTVNGFFQFHQLYFDYVGFTSSFIGLLFGLMYFIAGLSGKFAPWIEEKFGLKTSVLMLPFILVFVYVIMGLFPVSIVALIILLESFDAGIQDILISDLQNRFIPSQFRATILSLSSFVGNIFKAIFVFLVGYSFSLIDIPNTYVLVSLMLLVFSIPLVILLRKELVTYQNFSK